MNNNYRLLANNFLSRDVPSHTSLTTIRQLTAHKTTTIEAARTVPIRNRTSPNFKPISLLKTISSLIFTVTTHVLMVIALITERISITIIRNCSKSITLSKSMSKTHIIPPLYSLIIIHQNNHNTMSFNSLIANISIRIKLKR